MLSTDQVGCMVFLDPAAVDRGIKKGAESTKKALLLLTFLYIQQ